MRVRKKTLVFAITSFILFYIFYGNVSNKRGNNTILEKAGWLQPNFYFQGDEVELIVNKVESDLTQLPYAYYDLPFTCPPTMHKKPLHLSLNEIIRGDRKWQSDYILKFGQDDTCHILCTRKTTKEGLKNAKKLVEDGYVVQWLIDEELPAATTFISTIDQKKYYASGFPLGFVDPDTGKVYLNTHVMLVIRYNTVDVNKHTIVGFEVYPKSVSDFHCPGASKNYEPYEIVIPENDDDLTFIPFTYSVYWREEYLVDWDHRWDLYLNSGELSENKTTQFHWISLANSAGIVFLMSFVVSVILLRSFKSSRDISTDINKSEEHRNGLVYEVARNWIINERTPLANLLILFVSMGVQFLFTVLGSLTISCSLNKLHDIGDSVLTMAVLCFVLGAFMSSYIGSVLLRLKNKATMKKQPIKKGFHLFFAILCGSFLPGIVMIVTLLLNSIVWAHDSTHALPFKTVVMFITVYFIVCIPLSILGGYMANSSKTKGSLTDPKFHTSRPELELFANKLKPKKHIFLFGARLKSIKIALPILLSGIFPFVIIYVELQYVYKSVWLEKTAFYYFYGFLFANILLLCIVVGEIAIIGTYTMLHMADRNNTDWRWISFFMGSSCAWYMELYSLYYVFFILNIRGFSSIFISVCYGALFNTLCGCAMGSIASLTSHFFVEKLYRYKFQDYAD
ncbi:Tmn3p NDAI_0A01510 [Naumovozyma dairenensis CBS 421]|uniref:Transmembrane 9 superfamily member n=1 Tax=Naumovozyma dairenensis (strain ATCC 10597 / BCRC 20456 / CBS 421 / NBRC 0211 / NRRL Y-12639) TaxID=1071378 RepID=G0W3C1_NAUDC|nr:hypothetical protein NDAI_0A01510 [Naumovozyma dairenensis CBS 421]CCD22309.1 hypothetical protein NDAI_0A01510 [Naumovozyma dairenensis CBS 421]